MTFQLFTRRAMINTWQASQRLGMPKMKTQILCTQTFSISCGCTSQWARGTQRCWQWRGQGRDQWHHPHWTRCCQMCAWESLGQSLWSWSRSRSWPSESYNEGKIKLFLLCYKLVFTFYLLCTKFLTFSFMSLSDSFPTLPKASLVNVIFCNVIRPLMVIVYQLTAATYLVC